MARAGYGWTPDGIAMSSMVYNKVSRVLCEAVERTHGQPLNPGEGSPKDRFAQVVEQIERLLSTESERRRFADGLDVEVAGTVREIVDHLVEDEADETKINDVDDFAPATIKAAMYDVAKSRGSPGTRVEVPLQDFLRDTLRTVFERTNLKGRINIGANRHFSRLLQYARECEAETWWSDTCQGLRLRNAGGRGKVADQPTRPATLKLIIDLDNL